MHVVDELRSGAEAIQRLPILFKLGHEPFAGGERFLIANVRAEHGLLCHWTRRPPPSDSPPTASVGGIVGRVERQRRQTAGQSHRHRAGRR